MRFSNATHSSVRFGTQITDVWDSSCTCSAELLSIVEKYLPRYCKEVLVNSHHLIDGGTRSSVCCCGLEWLVVPSLGLQNRRVLLWDSNRP